MQITEAKVFSFSVALLLIVAIVCVLTSQWFGVIGSTLGAINGLAARSFLLQLKPQAATE